MYAKPSETLPVCAAASDKPHLENDFNALVEEAVDQQNRTVERHDGQEECEKPGQRDGGNDAQILHVLVQQRQTLAGQLLKHTLIHQRSWHGSENTGEQKVTSDWLRLSLCAYIYVTDLQL